MRKMLLAAGIALTLCSCGSSWHDLFEGDSFSQWQSVYGEEFPQVGWSLRNGVVTSNPEGVRGGDIITRKTYDNFILKVEFKLDPLSNSGIKYFIRPGTYDKPNIGCEYQIIDDKDFSEQVEALDENRLTGALYDILEADKRNAHFDSKSWNTARIEVRGNTVIHFLNGVEILRYDRESPAFDAAVSQSKFAGYAGFGKWDSGHILLQDHDHSVHFRHVRIKELK